MEARETIEQAQQAIIDEFARFDDWEDRYRHIISLGRDLPDIPDDCKIEKFRVRGCQSTVYLKPELRDGRVHFYATSDAMIVRGLIALLMRVFNDRTPDEIVATQPEFIHQLGLSRNLSQGRANGLAAMIEQIKLYGLAFKTMQSQARTGG